MSDNNNININTPEIGPYTRLQPFRFWCQKVLPLVYDESLSYYELLCKVVDYLNKTMEDVDQMITDMGDFQSAYTEFTTETRDAYIAFSREVNQAVEGLETFMNNYFNNLNVQTEINNKLDAMAEAGYFDTLFTTLFTDDIITEAGSVTSAWIAENLLQETGYVIDNSLTVENAAADAKATGTHIFDLEYSDRYKIGEIFREAVTTNRYNFNKHVFKKGEYVTVKYVAYDGADSTNINFFLRDSSIGAESDIAVYPNGLTYLTLNSEWSFIVPPEADGFDILRCSFNDNTSNLHTIDIKLGWNEHDREYIKNKVYVGQPIGSDGKFWSNANRASTGVIPYDRPITITVKAGVGVAYMIGQKNNAMTDKGYLILPAANTDGATVIINDNPANYSCVGINFVCTSAIADADRIGLIISPLDSNDKNIVSLINQNNSKVDPLYDMIKEAKIDMLTNTVTISNIENTIAVSDGFDIGEDGLLCAGACMASNAVGEWDNPAWNGYLITANIADPEKTKKVTRVFPLWGTLPVFSGWSINFVQHVIAKRTGADEISILAQVGLQLGDDTKIVNCVRKYTISTDTLAGDAVICDVDVLNTTYDMIYDNYILAKADIEAIWSATGIEHPVGYSGTDQYYYTIGQNPKKFNNYYWLPVGLGNQSHALCKTADLIHWEFVCDIPLEQASEEVAIAFDSDTCYATSRGNYTVDSQYSKLTKCDVDELDGEHWTTPIILAGCKLERPTIAVLNDKLYIMQGTGESATTEGENIARGKKVLLVFDTDLTLLKRTALDFTFPILHPQFLTFGGNLWTVTSSDKRCFAYTYHGDGRSELSFAHLNEKLLGL